LPATLAWRFWISSIDEFSVISSQFSVLIPVVSRQSSLQTEN
jgi:hypothetical protein